MNPGHDEDLRLPALTGAEAAFIDHYLAVGLRDALALMFERGETVMPVAEQPTRVARPAATA
jgi:hypothetical protein